MFPLEIEIWIDSCFIGTSYVQRYLSVVWTLVSGAWNMWGNTQTRCFSRSLLSYDEWIIVRVILNRSFTAFIKHLIFSLLENLNSNQWSTREEGRPAEIEVSEGPCRLWLFPHWHSFTQHTDSKVLTPQHRRDACMNMDAHSRITAALQASLDCTPVSAAPSTPASSAERCPWSYIPLVSPRTCRGSDTWGQMIVSSGVDVLCLCVWYVFWAISNLFLKMLLS